MCPHKVKVQIFMEGQKSPCALTCSAKPPPSIFYAFRMPHEKRGGAPKLFFLPPKGAFARILRSLQQQAKQKAGSWKPT